MTDWTRITPTDEQWRVEANPVSIVRITEDGEVTVLTTPSGSCVMGPSIAIC